MVSEEKSHRQKEELPMTAMFVNGSGKWLNFIEDLPWMFPTKVRFFGQVVSEEKIQMWKANRRGMPSDSNSSHAILVRWAKKM